MERVFTGTNERYPAQRKGEINFSKYIGRIFPSEFGLCKNIFICIKMFNDINSRESILRIYAEV